MWLKHFVEQVLTKSCIKYPNKKPRRIYWFFNPWQRPYTSLKSALCDEIQFTQGLPELSEDLHEINPKFNNVLVFDDLMSQAIDSPVLSKLFTQGRHRNASVILLLQNMFPKGKFNTDIGRNAQYMVLFRSPSGRKQIDIIAERIFAKDRLNFMNVYGSVSAKPYGYILIDNQPKTTSDKQVVSDVFGHCQSYPHITTGTHLASEVTQGTPETVFRKRCIDQSDVKNLLTKKPRKQSKNTKQRVKTKPETKKKKQPKRTKPAIYNPKFIVTPPRESSEEEQFNSEEEQLSSEDDSLNALTTTFHEELITIARQHKGFGPKIMYE